MRTLKFNRALPLALAAACLFFTGTAYAAEPVSGNGIQKESGQALPTKEQLKDVQEQGKGSVTVELEDGKAGTNKQGIRIYCQKVAEISSGEYVLEEGFQDAGADLNAVETADQLKEAAEALAAKKQAGAMKADTRKDGTAAFSGLDTGVYLIFADDSAAYDTVEPTLVAVPTWNEQTGEFDYDVTVQPKHTEKPDAPGKTAPQTGLRENTGYYLLAGAGCVLLAGVLGPVLSKKRKKKNG